RRPLIIGKQDASGERLLRSEAELDPEDIVKALASVLADPLAGKPSLEQIERRLRTISEIEGRRKETSSSRNPNFCSGCPHNRSTVLLEGQVAGGGIGCHAMAALLPHSGRSYAFLTHMGGEGAPWIGMEPFVERRHIFQNVGDGTYFHSGQLAVQACVASGVNITYKILYNSAVAMTGAQDVEAALSVPELTHKLIADGVTKVIVCADEPERHRGASFAD